MNLVLVSLGPQYLFYRCNEDSPPAGGDIVRFNSRDVAGHRFLDRRMEEFGYLITDRVHAYWLLRGCPTLPDSHPLRCLPSKLPRWTKLRNQTNLARLAGTTSTGETRAP